MLTKIKNKVIRALSDKTEDNECAFIKDYLPQEQPINILDIGAHKGRFIDAISKLYPLNKAFLFEPIPECYSYLKENFPGYEVFPYALSNSDGQIDFYVNKFLETSSLLQFRNISELSNINTDVKEIVKVRKRILDDIPELINIPIDIIKIDVQGNEHLVLEGARETLKRTKYIYTEISFKQLYVNSTNFFDLYSLLSSMDFNLHEVFPGHRAQNGELLQGNAWFKRK